MLKHKRRISQGVALTRFADKGRLSGMMEFVAIAIFVLSPVWMYFLACSLYNQAAEDIAGRTAQKITQPQAENERR